jgi:chitinase
LPKDEINNYIGVVIDNKPLPFTVSDGMGMPFIDENNRTLVPVRKLLQSIGAKVGYTSVEKGKVVWVFAELDGKHIEINIGSQKYSANGKNLTMDTVAIIRDGRTYIPARTDLEAFGYKVSYSKEGKSVYATSN